MQGRCAPLRAPQGKGPRQYIDFMPPRALAWLSQHWSLALARLPSQCHACHRWSQQGVLCIDCWQRFAPDSHRLRCPGCALPLHGVAAGTRCGTCLRHPPPWHSAHCWADYVYPWLRLVHDWKFQAQPALARHLAQWMRHDPALHAALAAADLVVPIPLSAQRMRQRGYNPAAQLARTLAPDTQAPHALQRVRDTPAQSQLTWRQRRRNLQGAFVVPTDQQPGVQGRHIVLLDDVMTTGATLAAATASLQAAGAACVSVVCLARTLPSAPHRPSHTGA